MNTSTEKKAEDVWVDEPTPPKAVEPKPEPKTESKPPVAKKEVPVKKKKAKAKPRKRAKKTAVKRKPRKAAKAKPTVKKKAAKRKPSKKKAGEKETLNFKVIPAEAAKIRRLAERGYKGNMTQMIRVEVLGVKLSKKQLEAMRATTRSKAKKRKA